MKNIVSESITKTSKKHRVLSVVALLGLFVCGMMFAFAINNARIKNMAPSCQAVEKVLLPRLKSYVSTDNLTVYDLLIKNGCSENVEKYTALLDIEKQIISSERHEVEVETETQSACEGIEDLLKMHLYSDASTSYEDHLNNVRVYSMLAERGCAENTEKYKQLASRDLEISEALRVVKMEFVSEGQRVCISVESLLKRELSSDDTNSYIDHLNNARVYSMLAERGCAENAEKYKQMALRDIEISKALSDGNIEKNEEAEEIIEVYKRLKMEREAQVVLDKLKKMTEPTIDFILRLEKIINEE